MTRKIVVGLVTSLACTAISDKGLLSAAAGQPPAAIAPADPAALKQHGQLQTEAKSAHQRGDLATAIAKAQQALKLEAQLYGSESPQRAASLELLAQWHMDGRNYVDARAARKEAATILRNSYGPADWRSTDAALALADVDKYESFSDEQFRQLQDLEKRHAEMLQFYRRGDYRSALALSQQNVVVYAQLMGTEHTNYSALLNNLAAVHIELANFAAVDQLLEESIAIQRRILGDNHPGLAAGYHNLGKFRSHSGDYRRAKTAFEASLSIKGRLFGEKSQSYAVTLQELAANSFKMGNRTEAARLLDKCRQTNQQNDEAHATLLNNLASLAWDMGRRQEAERLYRTCVQLRKDAYGDEDPRYAAALANLAGIHHARGEEAKAEELYLTALKITEASLGGEHPQTAEFLACLGEVAVIRNDFVQAGSYLQRALSIANQMLYVASRSQSQRQELLMRNTFRTYLDKYLALATRHRDVTKEAYRFLLSWKGAALVRNRDLHMISDHPELKELFAALQSNASQLSALVSAHAAMDRGIWRREMARLEETQDSLERQLSRRSSEFRTVSTSLEVDALLNILPEDVVLLDFIEFEDLVHPTEASTSQSQPARFMLVFIVRHGQPVRAVKLGDAAETARQVDLWRHSLGSGPQAQEAAAQLKSRLWTPLAADVDDAKTVLIAPDGILGLFPFNVLPGDEPNSYLIEQCRIATVPVPQLILRLMREESLSEPQYDLLLMGGIDYDGRDEKPALQKGARPANRLFANLRGGGTSWKQLAGAEAEIVVIKDLFESHLPGSKIIERRGRAATEESFCQLAPQCRILHIATHGFFTPGNSISGAVTGTSKEQHDPQDRVGSSHNDPVIYNPDLLSGLVFAGANNPPPFPADLSNLASLPEDGLLTAEEAAFVSLGGVQLAVLSACESAAGSVASGEGLLGVQRSFQMAGAKSTIASLWKVNDLATRRIMEEFYRNCLQRELSPLDALRDAQLWALRNPDLVPRGNIDKLETAAAFSISRNHLPPQYWAAFTLSGDWR